MQFDLISGSEHAAHALYDPAVVGRPPRDDADVAWDVWLERQVTSGAMLHYYRGGDEELRLKLCVDEPFEPPAAFTKRGEVDGAILRVESGKLVLSGIDAFYAAEGDDDGLAKAEVPPGTYRVNAFRADYRLSQARMDAEVAPQLEPGDAEYAQRVDRFAMPLGCAVMLVAVLAAATFLFAAAEWSFRLVAAAVALAVGAAAAVVVWRLLESPRMSRLARAKDDLWKRYPPTVVVLRRFAEGQAVPSTGPAARFGE